MNEESLILVRLNILEDELLKKSIVKMSDPNENGVRFAEVGVVMLTNVDVDYDNPDIEKCRKIVLDDFSNKILTLFKENPFGIKKEIPHTFIYRDINNRWLKYCSMFNARDCKQILAIRSRSENVPEYIQEYIKDYMEHNYIGRGVTTPTVDDIINWCGGGEFPFIEVYLLQSRRENVTWLCYYISR